jgi:Na+/melibiose symporter-like transporter
VSGLRGRLWESLQAFRAVFQNPNLRRLQLAWAGSIIGHWAYGIALAVFAYEQGGVTAVGIVGLARMLPAAIAAPFMSTLADRYPRERIMLISDLTRLVAMAAAAVVALSGWPAVFVYALGAAEAVMRTAFQPAQSAITPTLARSPQELTASNVTSSTIESVGVFLGPALGGLLLAATSPGVVFAATAVTYGWSALLVSRIKAERPEPSAVQEHLAKQALDGFRMIAVDSKLRLLIGLFAAQTLVAGALNVLIVVTALDLLDLGNAGVGYLNSAIGIGGLLGAFAAAALVGRRNLASPFGIGIVLWGVPIALIGLWPEPLPALLLLGLLGVGNTVVDVAGLTLLQRAVPDDILARVFGVLESLAVATIGLGAILAPLLVSAFGARPAMVITGALLPVVTALFWRRLTGIDAGSDPAEHLELLRSLPLFRPLPPATIEHLASSLVPIHVSAGEDVFRQGQSGDRFYIVKSGEVVVSVDGEPVNRLGPGGYFGEIALLRDVPRTATVAAETETELLALERDEFIAAVTGHSESAEVANTVIASRLGGLRSGVASV